MRVCVCVFIYLFYSCFHFYSYLRTIYVYCAYYLFYFDIAFTHFLEKMRIQNTENSEEDNSETKQEIRTKREVNKENYNMTDYTRSPQKVFLGRGVLKICYKFRGEHPCRSLISIKFLI